MLDEKILIQEEEEWIKNKELLKRKIKVEKAKAKFKNALKNKTLTTTKLLIYFLFFNCTALEIFTGWVTVKNLQLALSIGITPDFTPLIALIGAVVGNVISFAIYAIKSVKENTEGGVVYMNAQREYNNNNSESEG